LIDDGLFVTVETVLMPETQPTLTGDLSRIQLPDVLSFLAMIRGTGKLLLRHAQLERSIHWKDGEIVFASSNSPEHSLGMFLLRNGKITPEQYEESKRRVTANLRHGKLLVQMGAISPKDLWWGVKNQALEIIYSLFGWKDGSFAFGDATDELANERIVLSINTSTVIMEGIRRLDETAMIREKITSLDMVFLKEPGAVPDFASLEMSDHEVALYNNVDGKQTIRELIGRSEMTEFEVTRLLLQLLSARLIEVSPEEKAFRPVFLDVEDSPELLRVISTYNDMFGRLYEALLGAVGEETARDIVMTAMQNADSDELWSGVFFDQYGRFDENMLIANISELPFERRKAVLDEGLNTLLSVQLFEVSRHLDSAGKVDVFRFISDQKASLEASSSGSSAR
jgi:DNA-binding MarR family transcriptional regulator